MLSIDLQLSSICVPRMQLKTCYVEEIRGVVLEHSRHLWNDSHPLKLGGYRPASLRSY
nr:BB1 [Rattus norvegicus]